ncbi:MAG: AAA family ATPase [Paracoccus sp. (in: a-proteobacteria)]|uniref:AAA family ATPase n=1 Tax=Paracoccus sp. TaxID=267 RepID=UPI0026E10B99|nr:AAA family ATPase [Paracoccus sp. (in: a-proteobacteria)]MDO5631110.1 AAA family ATPase [Paracoccus sp. (in: a-proteobacteria)]
MNTQAKQEGWELPRQTAAISDQAVLDRWQEVTTAIRDVAAVEGWTKSEVARRADMPLGTFSAWYDGTYSGRYDTTTQRVQNFLNSRLATLEVSRGMPVEPGFVQTRLARELFTAFTYAQMIPTMAVITVASGLGKSLAAETFAASRPHVTHVTLSPSSAAVHTMKAEIAAEMGLDIRDGAQFKRAITSALKRTGHHSLLIVDEAQNLGEDAINELRHFRDMAKCGLVLLGNEEGKTPYAGRDPRHSSAQVARRVGHRLNVLRPYPEDLEAIVAAWNLPDPAAIEMARKIARMPGGFGTLRETVLTAGMIATGHDRDITADDLKAAWENRGAGVLK